MGYEETLDGVKGADFRHQVTRPKCFGLWKPNVQELLPPTASDEEVASGTRLAPGDEALINPGPTREASDDESHDRVVRKFCIAGTWCDFKPVEMERDGPSCFVHVVTIGQNNWESF